MVNCSKVGEIVKLTDIGAECILAAFQAAHISKGAIDICMGEYFLRQKKDTFFKRSTALMFYKLMSMLGVDVVYNHADYRLVSKRILNELEHYKEVNLFLRGIFPLIGFNSSMFPL